ncbi:zinc ribbon domain-containing protein [Methanosarcina baikalica]|uniref:zinc ribbon domain-containing protein n=1 Tax=Methanosarcina baikalica TaxID=3073890 RepID=UPI0037C8D558
MRIYESYTSKECSVCRKRHNLPLSQRTIICNCGNILNRDLNDAINIMQHFLLKNALWVGYQRFSDNLRQTGLSIGIWF